MTFAEHIQELAGRYRVMVSVDPLMPPEFSHAHENTRQICIAPVQGEETYAVALHEMGHIVVGSSTLRNLAMVVGDFDLALKFTIQEERKAWDWAKAHAMLWDERMERIERWAFSTYTKNDNNYQSYTKKYNKLPS